MDVRAIDFPSIFTKEQLAYIAQSVTEQAREVFGGTLRDVILYGSYARGDYEEWSDVDMMVLADVDDLTGKKLEAGLLKRLGDLNHHMNLLLSILVVPNDRFEYFKEYLPFYTNVNQEGVRLCSTNVR
jgi:predicted nucleotidyltransferase